MPLYDCVLLLKPTVGKEALLDLVYRVGKHVYKRNGVITDVRSLGTGLNFVSREGKHVNKRNGVTTSVGTVQLGYGVRKLDGRYYQGQLLQMTMMAPPSINSELHYLNKEDRLLRWLLIKNRGSNCLGLAGDSSIANELNNLRGIFYDGEIFKPENFKDDEYDDDDDDDDDHVGEQPES